MVPLIELRYDNAANYRQSTIPHSAGLVGYAIRRVLAVIGGGGFDREGSIGHRVLGSKEELYVSPGTPGGGL
ncbi:MAG: hypothetical protein JKZ02_02770 [Erythrobacter sp.]|nr:hypothetical protein [Erythrobacter sp.]